MPLPGRGVSAESSLREGMGMGTGVGASRVASVSWLLWPPHVEKESWALGGSRLGSDTGGICLFYGRCQSGVVARFLPCSANCCVGKVIFLPGSSHLEVGNQLVLFWDLSAPWEREPGPGVEMAGRGLMSGCEPGVQPARAGEGAQLGSGRSEGHGFEPLYLFP